jgi:nicotinate-nucleotide adenylyltransferase
LRRKAFSYTALVKRLGIFGGTFDPVHIGHLALGCAAHHQLGLDRMLFVVAGDPWQKEGRVVASAEDRYAMVVAATAEYPQLEPSRVEVDRTGPTYTIDTVEQLANDETEVFLVVGSDAAARLDTWHRADELRTAVTVAVVARADGAPVAGPDGWRSVTVTMPHLAVSSTDLRRRLAAGEPVDVLVPPSVVRCIRTRGLYTARNAADAHDDQPSAAS